MGGGLSREGGAVPEPDASKEEAKKPVTTPAPNVSKTREASAGSTSRSTAEAPKDKEAPPKPVEVPPKAVEVPKESLVKPMKVPHMYQTIIKQADDPTDGSLLDKIRSSGIFLNNKNQKYWIEEKTGCNCFMLLARSLSITWSENQQFWQWVSQKETSDTEIEIARLLNVCWLEVHGRFETSYLTPGVMYEVVFVVMMELGYGWDRAVNVRLKLPSGDVKQRKERLSEIPKGKWIEIKVAEFKAESNLAGEMEFSLYEYEGGQWKRGLIIKGAILRPKK